MHFGENQLSRSLIGLSPLPTTHPLSFQPKWVRASTKSYLCFTLAMGRSPRFGSRTCHTHPYVRIRFRYGCPHSWLTTQHATDSQAHSSKGTPPPHKKQGAMTDYQHMVSGTLSLPSRGTFHHSLTVLIHYRSPRVFSLDKWSCHLHTRFHEPRATQEHTQTAAAISATGLSPTPAGLPRPFAYPDGFSLPGRTPARPQACPQHRTRTARRLIHAHGLGSSAFARHY